MPARWTRIEELTTIEAKALSDVCEKTPGLTLYGHRARAAVMLPVEVAKIVSDLSLSEGKSVSEIVNELLKERLNVNIMAAK